MYIHSNQNLMGMSNEHDIYTVSGLNCCATPISNAWEVQEMNAAPANMDQFEHQMVIFGEMVLTMLQLK